MKASRFSEAQIAFVLKQAEDGTIGWRGVPQGRDLGGDVLQLAQEVRWADAL